VCSTISARPFTDADSYAPATPDILCGRGYDYWALGHIHARQVISEDPYIAYSGNTQGRHIKEIGAKGCLLVSVDDGRHATVEFRATDVLRWHTIDLRLTADDDVSSMIAAARTAIDDTVASADGRPVAARLTVRGACAALVSAKGRNDALDELALLASEIGECIWIERLAFETSAPLDVVRLREGQDLLGDLLRSIEGWRQEGDVLQAAGGVFDGILESYAGDLEQSGVNLCDPGNLRRWLDQAEALLVARLVEHAP
jgi:hypothetical protein